MGLPSHHGRGVGQPLQHIYPHPPFLAPFHHAELAVATAIGVAVFGEMPGLVAGAGISLIAAAGLWVALQREHAGAGRWT